MCTEGRPALEDVHNSQGSEPCHLIIRIESSFPGLNYQCRVYVNA